MRELGWFLVFYNSAAEGNRAITLKISW